MRRWLIDINQYAGSSDILLGRLSVLVYANTANEAAQKINAGLNSEIQQDLTVVSKEPVTFVFSAGARNRIQKITRVKGY